MNFLHPIVVHFPVALLTVYSILELIRFKAIMSKPHWFQTKGIVVTLGALGALGAFLTGPRGGTGRLYEMHRQFATITLLIYGLIAMSYLLEWLRPSKFTLHIMRPYVIIPLALLGLICVTITGGLGGAMVYGINFDPFMAPVFKLLSVY